MYWINFSQIKGESRRCKAFFRVQPNPELDFVTIFSRLFAKNEKAVA